VTCLDLPDQQQVAHHPQQLLGADVGDPEKMLLLLI
jgi:hypothetical protein